MDGGAQWAAVHGVATSQTRLSDSLPLFTFIHWRRNWQPTPVFLPGESQGWGSLVGCRLRGHTESDTTEATQQQQQLSYCDVFSYITMRWPHIPPPSYTPLPPPPHPSPLGCHRSPANSHRLSISHLILCVLQCYPLKASHPSFHHCVQKSAIYVCVSFAVLHIGSLVPSFQIPYRCVNIQYLSF